MKKITKYLTAFASFTLFFSASGYANNYPDKAIKIVVPFAAGSATDKFARIIAEKMAKDWGQPVIVENKGGASGFIASSFVAKAPPDGYTIMVTSNTTHASNSVLFKNLPYDPVADFEPVSKLGTIPLALIINPSLPVKTVAELIDHARTNPGKIFFGSGSTSARMAGEMLKSMTNIEITNVQYKSNPEALTDLAGGHIQMMIADVTTTLPLSRNGTVRALGVSTEQPTPLAPGLPTIAAAGNLPEYEMVGWFASYVPAKTPKNIIDKINGQMVNIMSDPEVGRQLVAAGIQPESGTPEQLAEFQKAETEKWDKLVKAAGIPLQ